MQPFLVTHIHPSQTAFINDRWITNNVRHVNNVITKQRTGWLLFVDFSKAYNSINRVALIEIMKARCIAYYTNVAPNPLLIITTCGQHDVLRYGTQTT